MRLLPSREMSTIGLLTLIASASASIPPMPTVYVSLQHAPHMPACKYASHSSLAMHIPLRACNEPDTWRECHAHQNFAKVCVEARKWEKEVHMLSLLSPCAMAFSSPLEAASTCDGVRDLLACNATRLAIDAFRRTIFEQNSEQGVLSACMFEQKLEDKIDMVEDYVALNLVSANFFFILLATFQTLFLAYVLVLPQIPPLS